MSYVGEGPPHIASWGTDSCAQGYKKTIREGLKSFGCRQLPLATHSQAIGGAGLAERTFRAVGMLCTVQVWLLSLFCVHGMYNRQRAQRVGQQADRASWGGSGTSGRCEVGGAKMWEGGVYTLCDLCFRSQEPSKNQKQFSLKK